MQLTDQGLGWLCYAIILTLADVSSAPISTRLMGVTCYFGGASYETPSRFHRHLVRPVDGVVRNAVSVVLEDADRDVFLPVSNTDSLYARTCTRKLRSRRELRCRV